MVKIIPNQSGMDFIAENTFHIEEAAAYDKLRDDKIRSVEFIRIKNDKLLFIEAKTTFPNPDNPSEENKIKYQAEINEICEKFIHSLNLLLSIEIGVAIEEYPNDFIIPEKSSFGFFCQGLFSKQEKNFTINKKTKHP